MSGEDSIHISPLEIVDKKHQRVALEPKAMETSTVRYYSLVCVRSAQSHMREIGLVQNSKECLTDSSGRRARTSKGHFLEMSCNLVFGNNTDGRSVESPPYTEFYMFVKSDNLRIDPPRITNQPSKVGETSRFSWEWTVMFLLRSECFIDL